MDGKGSRQIGQQAGTVCAGHLDHGGGGALVQIDHGGGPHIKGRAARIGRGDRGRSDRHAAEGRGLQRPDQPGQAARLGLPIRRAAAVLKLEHVKRSAVSGGRHPGSDDIGAGGGQGVCQIDEQAGTIAGGDGHAGRGAFVLLAAPDRDRFGGGTVNAGAGDQSGVVVQRIGVGHVLAPEHALGALIEVADQAPLPGVPDPRADSADVSHGQDQQGPQTLRVADQFGEGADRRRVGHIAFLGVVAEGQVVAHQPDHELRPARVEAQSVAGAPRRNGSVFQLATVAALADIMQQHGQHQGLEIVRFGGRSRSRPGGQPSACRARCH